MKTIQVECEELLETVGHLQKEAKEFFERNTINLTSLENQLEFDIFRKNILITFKENVNALFKDDRVIQMYFNAVHSVIPLATSKNCRISMEDPNFLHFFYAALLFVSKVENMEYYHCFYESAVKAQMTFTAILQIEQNFINKAIKFYFFSPQEILDYIFFLLKNVILDKVKIQYFIEATSDLVYYCLSELEIFSKFDQFDLTIACICFILKKEDPDTIIAFYQILSTIGYNESTMLDCVRFIDDKLGNEDDDFHDEAYSMKTSTSTTFSSAEKENSRKPIHRKLSQHNKVNKLNQRKKKPSKSNSSQISINTISNNISKVIPQYYKVTKKRKTVGRIKTF